MKHSPIFYTFILLSLAVPLHGMDHRHSHDEFNEHNDTRSTVIRGVEDSIPGPVIVQVMNHPSHDEFDEHNDLLNDARNIVIRSVANTICAAAVDGALGYCSIINHDKSPYISAIISGSGATLVDRGLTDFEFIPAKPTAPLMGVQGANELIQIGTGIVTKAVITKCLAAFKSNIPAINSAPVNAVTATSSQSIASVAAPISNTIVAPSFQSIALGTAPMVMSIISGQVTDAAINYAQPHIQHQVHEFLRHLGENYSKKEEFLDDRAGTCALPNIPTKDALNQYWNPTDDTTLSFLDRTCIYLNRYQSTQPHIQQIYESISDTQTLRCKLYQKESAIIVEETVSNDSFDWCTITSTYESSGTMLNYLFPFGLHRFRPAMTALKNKILAHHITVAGSGIKLDSILEPEPLSAAESKLAVRKAIADYNESVQ